MEGAMMRCVSVFLYRIIYLLLLTKPGSECQLSVPGLDNKAYVKLGDINIGYLSYVYKSSATGFCSNSYRASGAQHSVVPGFITDLINNDDSILPNISLGFVGFDDCQKDLTALARSLYFVPSAGKIPGSTSRYQGVVGVVGPNYSRQAVMISGFLSLFKIPVLSTYASSDDLSDKSRFPYFMRLVPPNAFQALALMDIIKHFGWTYVSLLYSEGSYGENAAKLIEKLAHERHVCLHISKGISFDYDDAEIGEVVNKIRANKLAPVVILFLESMDITKLFSNVKSKNLTSEFVWLSGDTFPSFRGSGLEDVAIGSIFVSHPLYKVPGLRSYMMNLSWKNSTNPWLPLVFESAYGCTWDIEHNNESGKDSCRKYDTLAHATGVNWVSADKHTDGFVVYAMALHNLISDTCPHLFRKESERNFTECIDGELLLEYMKNVSFSGFSGHIAFDKRGDMLGSYYIKQVSRDANGIHFHRNVLGVWNKLTESLDMKMPELYWPDKKKGKIESICSSPCEIGHYYQKRKVSCCWDCIPCRENEFTDENRTQCQQCPKFTWPNQQTKSECIPIEHSYLKSNSATGVSLLCLASIGVLVSLGIITVYMMKKDHPLLKATSRELCIVMLIGCKLACVCVFLLVAKPSRISCLLCRSGFHVVVSIIYAPLLFKSIRVYRIFRIRHIARTNIPLISNRAQLSLVSLVICVQALIVVLLEIVYPSKPIPLMPFHHQPYVELTCQVNLESFIPPLCFNMLPIMTCAVVGYLIKSLPENFNDSRYIFLSISTTLFMWIVFLPTYFTTFHAHHKTALLAVCLLLNTFITTICQFGPKCFAVFYMEDKNMRLIINNVQMNAPGPSQGGEPRQSHNTTATVAITSIELRNSVATQVSDINC